MPRNVHFYSIFQAKVEDLLDVPSIPGLRMTVLMKMRVFRIQGQHYHRYQACPSGGFTQILLDKITLYNPDCIETC